VPVVKQCRGGRVEKLGYREAAELSRRKLDEQIKCHWEALDQDFTRC